MKINRFALVAMFCALIVSEVARERGNDSSCRIVVLISHNNKYFAMFSLGHMNSGSRLCVLLAARPTHNPIGRRHRRCWPATRSAGRTMGELY